MGTAWGDYDNDGDMDIYIAKSGAANMLLRNDGSGIFVDVTAAPLNDMNCGRGVSWGDFDNDGDLDLYLVNHYRPNRLFCNLGSGNFKSVEVAPLQDGGEGIGVGLADYDGDGLLDVYFSNYEGENKLVSNEVACGHWFKVKLQGTESNASGIGTRLEVWASGAFQQREICGSAGLCSQSSLTAEFGLGGATIVDTLIARWPSGNVERHYVLPSDTVITLVEASSGGALSGLPDIASHGLYSIAPNPFTGGVCIMYGLASQTRVTIRILDVRGRSIRMLLDSPAQPRGRHVAMWDGLDDRGRQVAQGIYFCRFEIQGYAVTRKMILAR
jgi:hypothetical protein